MVSAPENPWWVTLACVGATLIVTEGSIFTRLRAHIEFLHCPQCVGFWMGVLGGITAGFHPLMAFGHGCSVSLLSWLAYAVLNRLKS